MNCSWIKPFITYECHPVKTRSGEQGLVIAAPFAFSDGTAINTLITPAGDGVFHVSDWGLLSELDNLTGVELNKREVAKIKRAAEVFRIVFDPDTETFRSLATHRTLAEQIALMGSLAVTAERIARPDHELVKAVDELANMLAVPLQRLDPSHVLERDKKIKGKTGAQYSFTFCLGKKLYDIVKPRKDSVGIAMRKNTDITEANQAANEPSYAPCFILDDREDITKAADEQWLLGRHAETMLVSALLTEPALAKTA